jgi:Tfp pilus assembly protein PilO
MKSLSNQLPPIVVSINAPRASSPLPLWRRLRWTWRRSLRARGWPVALAVVMLVICAILYFSMISPAQKRLAAARHTVFVLQQQNALDRESLKENMHTPEEQLADFYKRFPSERHSPQWLGKLVEAAESVGLSLNEGEYKATREKVGKLVRYQIALPVKGEYPQIRKFLAALPGELPVFTLESVTFERKKVADAIVEVKIKLILYLERAS